MVAMVNAFNELLFAWTLQKIEHPGPGKKAEKGGTGRVMRLHT